MPRSEPDHLVDAHDAAAYAAKVTGKPCADGTIRSWASRGHITRHGRRGRATLYDIREVHRWVTGEDPDTEAPHTPTARSSGMSTIDAYTLSNKIRALLADCGVSDEFGIRILWPAFGVADRELTDADRHEAQRLAHEEWRIEVHQRPTR